MLIIYAAPPDLAALVARRRARGCHTRQLVEAPARADLSAQLERHLIARHEDVVHADRGDATCTCGGDLALPIGGVESHRHLRLRPPAGRHLLARHLLARKGEHCFGGTGWRGGGTAPPARGGGGSARGASSTDKCTVSVGDEYRERDQSRPHGKSLAGGPAAE